MDKILVDTNVVLDLLAGRVKFLPETQKLFSLADKNKVKLYVSSLSFANLYYILNRQLKSDKARNALRKLKILVEILPMDGKIVELALASDFRDFEDAIQYFTAIENGMDLIVTRNLKDFIKSEIPVMTAKDYLETIK